MGIEMPPSFPSFIPFRISGGAVAAGSSAFIAAAGAGVNDESVVVVAVDFGLPDVTFGLYSFNVVDENGHAIFCQAGEAANPLWVPWRTFCVLDLGQTLKLEVGGSSAAVDWQCSGFTVPRRVPGSV